MSDYGFNNFKDIGKQYGQYSQPRFGSYTGGVNPQDMMSKVMSGEDFDFDKMMRAMMISMFASNPMFASYMQKQGVEGADPKSSSTESIKGYKSQMNTNKQYLNESGEVSDVKANKPVKSAKKTEKTSESSSSEGANSEVKADSVSELEKQLETAGVKNAKIKLNKSTGAVEVDLSKMTEAQMLTLQDNGGLNYSGSSALSVKTKEGQNLTVNITGDANQVNLEGSGTANINTASDNKALQVKASKEAKIGTITGENLEHLVVKGGNMQSDLSGLTNLQALKLDGTKLEKGLNVKGDKDLAVNLNGVDANGKDLNIAAGEDASVKIARGKNVGNTTVAGRNTDLTAANTDMASVTTKAEKNNLTKLYNSDVEGDLDVSGQESTVTLNQSTVAQTNAEGSEKTSLFVGKDADAGAVSLSDNKEGNEIVAEDEDAADKLEDQNPDIKEKSAMKRLDKGDISQEALFKKYFGYSNKEYKQYQEELQNSQYNAQAYGWGATPGGMNPAGGGSVMMNFLNGWQFGNQVTAGMYNNLYGNPYGYNSMMYNPYMMQGGYMI
ncbi:MAG: hypothetical protein PHE78_03145 [Candidatus Gastranaerophilales bacterium]|nr:hypothetical protein [Candidatus Gastranaerophilales bacterium]